MNSVFHSSIQLAQAAAPLEAPTTSSVVIVGFLFVVLVLALLAAVTSAIGAVFIKSAARDAAKAAQAAEKATEASVKGSSHQPATTGGSATGSGSAAAPGSSGIDEDPAVLAVIAAAVHTIMGDRAHRVVSVRSAGPGWAQEGRRQIFSSHRVR